MPKGHPLYRSEEETSREHNPYKGLLAAILQNAILDYCSIIPPERYKTISINTDIKQLKASRNTKIKNKREARLWLYADELDSYVSVDAPLPFTYIWVCYHLGLDYKLVRNIVEGCKDTDVFAIPNGIKLKI